MIIADTPEKIELYRMHVLHKMLKLEMLGIKFKSGMPTAYSAIKKEYNLKGSKTQMGNMHKCKENQDIFVDIMWKLYERLKEKEND